MQRDNTAHRSSAPTQNNHSTPATKPENPHPTPLATLPEKQPPRTIAVWRIANSPRAIVTVAAAIVLIALFWIAPALATGLVFATGLFGINTLIDSRMARGEK